MLSLTNNKYLIYWIIHTPFYEKRWTINLVNKIYKEIETDTTNVYVLNITWSLSGSNITTHSLSANSANPLPNWVSIDQDYKLTINSPDLKANETFLFNVDTLVAYDSQKYTQVVELLIYTDEEDNDAGDGVLASQAGMAVVAILTISTSVLGVSSLQSLWAIMNIIQLTMLLPLTLAFIPDIVVQYLIGMSFVNFNFDFIPLRDIPIIADLSFEANKGFISDMGLRSASTFGNHFWVVILLILIILFHLILRWINRLFKHKWGGEWKIKWDFEPKWYHKSLDKILNKLTFGVYVRIFLESFQIILLASLLELK